MGISISNSGGAGITVELDPNALPLSGGTLTGDLTIDGGSNGNKSLVINSVENWTIGMNDGTIEGWRKDPNDVLFNSYRLSVDGNEAYFKNWSDDDGSHWDATQIFGAGIYLYTYEGVFSSSLTNQKLEIKDDGAIIGRLTKDSLRFEDGTTDITIDATGVKFPNQYFNSSLSRGSFDSGRSSYNGISLICTQGIELNWQAGYLKALSGSYVVPINVESSIALTNATEVSADNINISVSGWEANEERVWSTSQNFSSFNGVSGDDNFHLHNGSVGGINNTGANSWGLGVGGAGGDDDAGMGWNISGAGAGGNNINDADTNWGINHIKAYGNDEDGGAVWEFGVNGAKFADGTIQTSAAIGLNSPVFDDNISVRDTNDGNEVFFAVKENNRVIEIGNFSAGQSHPCNTLFGNDYMLITGSENNGGSIDDGTIIIGRNYEGDDSYGVKFFDGSFQKIAFAPVVQNSALTQSGNMARTDYPKEIKVTIGGVTYAMPARIV